MDEKDFKKFMIPVLILLLGFLSFLVLKPIFSSVILGLLFAYLFMPLYKKIHKKIGSKNISSLLVILIACTIIVLPLALLLPSFTKQVFDAYLVLRNIDVSKLITKLLPTLINTPGISTEIISAASHFNSALTNGVLAIFQNTLLNLPTIVFGLLVILFTMFFTLRDGDIMWASVTSILPFQKEYHEKFYQRFSQVTDSVIYGHLIIGLMQGIIAGIGYYVFGIENALLLTIITSIVGIIPVIGPWLVWIPVDFFLFASGNTVAGMQLLIYGLFVINWIDTIARPVVVAEKAEMNSAIALIGVVGGVYAFGAIGFLLGPLILAGFLLMVELYRTKKSEDSIVLREVSPSSSIQPIKK
ncbi:MAG: AI-2E family transporter [archaeon]|nr:AI-2E family transporter [archaeon]